MAALVTELGYPWYVGMLADEDVSTVGDVLVKVGLHRSEEERSRTPEGFPLPADASGKAEFHRSQRSLSATSLSSAGDEPTAREDRLMFVSAYLVSLGFTEMHAAEISEEVVSKYDDARVWELSQGRFLSAEGKAALAHMHDVEVTYDGPATSPLGKNFYVTRTAGAWDRWFGTHC